MVVYSSKNHLAQKDIYISVTQAISFLSNWGYNPCSWQILL